MSNFSTSTHKNAIRAAVQWSFQMLFVAAAFKSSKINFTYQFLVQLFEAVKQLRFFFIRPGINVRPGINFGQSVAFPDGVVVWQPVVPASHDIEGGQVSAAELHGAEQHVSDV
jgi:hypothetical protein